MAKKDRKIMGLACSKCNRRNYTFVSRKKSNPKKLALKKYCPFCRKHTLHKEVKV